jgi:hypothetical protein
MAKGDATKTVRSSATESSEAGNEGLLLDLVDSDAKAGLVDEASLDVSEPLHDEDAVVLTLEDLVPDTSGEVVLMTEDDLAVNLVADRSMTDQGIADSHVTAGGVDVTGHHVYHFEGGITLYSPHDVVILSES